MRNSFIPFPVIAAAALLASCASADLPATSTPSPVPTALEAPIDPTPANPSTSLMYDLVSTDPVVASDALRHIRSDDDHFVPVLLEMMRAMQIGALPATNYQNTVAGLELLSGQSFGTNWADWIEWYGTTDIQPPPGFTGWKGQLLGRIDPGFAEFLRDDEPSRIRSEEILWGGVLVDGIPALDSPAMIAPADADYLTPEDPVFGIELNGDARAYPLRILDWHEMANDVIGGVPVSLAYCTLCGAAIAYDGRIGDQTVTFGSSGLLYRSNKLMYDRQTRTLWNQLTGEPVLGPLADQELTLNYLPVVLTTWGGWQAEHPDTQVVSLETGYSRYYELGAAYGDYFASSQTMFPVWQRSDLLPDKSQIYALRLDGVPKAYPVDVLVEEGVVNDVVGETPVVLVAADSKVIVQGNNLDSGPTQYSAGAEVRAYGRGDHEFAPGPDAATVVDEDGSIWQVTEEALIGPEGQRAERIAGHLAYWFGWFAFFPETLVYGVEG